MWILEGYMGNGPWWFAGVVGLAGVVVGAILKWVLDILSERRKQRLEVSSRFIETKREIYEEFLRLIDEAVTCRINADTNQAIIDGNFAHSYTRPPNPKERREMAAFIVSQAEAARSATTEAHSQLEAM